MSTDYKIETGKPHIDLSLVEHSGVVDLDLFYQAKDGLELNVTLAPNMSVEEVSEMGLRFLQVALYNCADVDKLRAWLHARVNEVDCSGTRTLFPKY